MSDTETAQTKLLHMMAQHQMAVGEMILRVAWGRDGCDALLTRQDELGKAYCEFCQAVVQL